MKAALNNKDWEAGYTAYKDILVGEGRGGGVEGCPQQQGLGGRVYSLHGYIGR